MKLAASEPPLEVSYPIAYRLFTGTIYNRDFKGKGTLTIRASGPAYIFQGQRTGMFSGPPINLELAADEIWNVAVKGRRVSFKTAWGEAGKKGLPFVFFCEDDATAQLVASLLPTQLDPDFVATHEFTTRLNALADAQSPWTSATNLIIALNALVFVIMGLLGAGWITVDSMMPYFLYGANNGAATTDGEWWRLLTSMFVHYGLIHLLLNMWALYQAGHFLEKLQGRALYTLTYLGSGLAGGILSIAWHGDKTWSAGASGAIFGVYGAILGYMLREKQGLPPGVYKPMMKSTLGFAAYNLFYGMRAGVDNSAHLGGLVGGFALGWLLALPVDREARLGRTRQKLQLGLGALAVMVAAGVFLTPRFNYSVADELKWDAVEKDFGPKESEFLEHHQKALPGLKRGSNGPAHAEWMAANLVPLYEQWGRRLQALSLAPGRLTAVRRDAVIKIFRLRLDCYRHLIAGLQAHQPGAIDRYSQEEDEIGKEIDKFQKSQPPSP